MPKISVIILNFNGKKFLETCLNSVLAQDYDNFEIILIENGSTDGSKEYLKEKYENNKKIKIIYLDKNTGFAEGNNIGIKKAFEDKNVKYIAALNNDTKVVSGWLSEMVKTIEKNEKTGSVSSKMIFFYEQNLINAVGVLISKDGGGVNLGYKEKDEGQFEKELEIFGPSAGAALYKREVLEKTDLGEDEYFDSDYFAYYEDVDLCWRLRLAGYTSYYSPKAVVYHVHSATGVSHSPFKAYHIQRNRLFNIVKDFPAGTALISFFFVTPWRYIHLLNSAFFRKSGPSQKAKEKSGAGTLFKIVFKAWWDFFKKLPAMLKKRKAVNKTKVVPNKEINKWFTEYEADLETMIYK